MNDFLLQYYMQLHFNKMPAEIRAQFDAYLKSDDFRGNMKDWKSKLMHDDNGKWVQNELPDPNDANGNFHLNDEEWKNLFKAFQNAFRAMSADAKSFKDNKKANDFLNEYFGNATTHLFSNGIANSVADAQIQGELKNFLTVHRQGLEIYLKQWGLIDGDFSYSDLLDGIGQKKYNTSPDFQNKIKTIAQYITFYVQQSDFQSALGLQPQNIPNFTDIENGFEDGAIDQQKLDYFKLNYKSLLNTLHDESKIYDVFRNYDKGKLSKPLDEAKSKVDYANKDSKDYVPPKRDDELTPWQQLSKNISDTWEDYMGKYTKLRGDRLYFSDAAKLIVKALDGTKFKPTDGLGKFVENIAKIKSNLLYKSPRAAEQFDWFAKTITELKSTMPKAFEGALKNGRQMKALISELILKAVREGKMDEAKTAMEVLSVIKYGYTTSKIMDALGKENLSIFSDGGLSWNKNEGVKFVTTAMDKSIKTAIMGVGYGITMAGNAIKLNGSKFNGDTGRIKKQYDAWVASNRTQIAETQTRNNTLNTFDSDNINTQQQVQASLNNGVPTAQQITSANLDQMKANIEQQRNANKATKQQLDTTSNDPQFKAAQKAVQDHDTLNQTIQQTQAQIQQLNNEKQQIQSDLAALNANATMSASEKNARAQILVQQDMQIDQDLQQLNQNLVNAQAQYNILHNDPNRTTYEATVNQFNTDTQNYDNAVAQTDAEYARISQWESAQKSIDELQQRITKRDEEIAKWDNNHKDKYKELMAYWDFLESGRDTHTGKMYSWSLGSAKLKQQNFDKKENLLDSAGNVIIDPATGRPKQDLHKNILFQQYLNDYEMAA